MKNCLISGVRIRTHDLCLDHGYSSFRPPNFTNPRNLEGFGNSKLKISQIPGIFFTVFFTWFHNQRWRCKRTRGPCTNRASRRRTTGSTFGTNPTFRANRDVPLSEDSKSCCGRGTFVVREWIWQTEIRIFLHFFCSFCCCNCHKKLCIIKSFNHT